VENKVEWVAGRWVVRGKVGCSRCSLVSETVLVIPESFLEMHAEEVRRRLKEAELTPSPPLTPAG